MASELKPCPFCRKPMMLREALWPSEGDTDAIIHADKTDCPMFGFGDGSADGSIVEKWNICSSHDEDDFPSDGSCVRCGSVPRNANGLCNTCLDEDAERLENTRPAPAATDTGLVTVGWLWEYAQYRTDDRGYYGYETVITENNPTDHVSPAEKLRNVRELVTRSQAAELLAAERVKNETQAETIDKLHGIITNLEADNAAQAARIKELEETKAVIAADKKTLLDLAATNGDKVTALEAKLATANALVTCCCGDLVDAHNMGSGHSPVDQYHYAMMQLEAKLAAAEKELESYKSIVKDVCESQRGTKWGKSAECIFDAIERAVLGGKP
ncbi:hypothetical protein NJB93_14620 [Brucella intermedia]|uniref:hypothetical protein n=1 Tax=Brucella intermedia TaxID=94625 RepID=UPI00209B48AB|nr:hypothetical protein [Brucella intermedia]MCO7727822.1 hypothetical protein [Brucella intermedia]